MPSSMVEQHVQEVTAKYLSAATLRPSSAQDAYSDLGVALSKLGQPRAAAAAYAQAIAIAPTHAVAYNNLASLLVSSQRRRAALELFEIAFRLQPATYYKYPQMHLNLAGELVDASRYDEAVSHYQHGLRYEQMAEDTLGRLAHLQQRVCDWRGVELLLPRLRRLVTRVLRSCRRPRRRPLLSPMHMLTLPFTADELLGVSRAHATAIYGETLDAGLPSFRHLPPPLPLLAPGDGSVGMLHVGLMSGDFKRHPVSILLAPMLTKFKHAHPRLQLTLFALNSDSGDPWRRYLLNGADRIEDLSSLGDADAAAAVNRARVHILIDLNGLYSRGARPRLLAARPAPLQVSRPVRSVLRRSGGRSAR